MKPRLEWRLVSVANCPTNVVTKCYELLDRHFNGVGQDAFLQDLREKEMIAYLRVCNDTSGDQFEVGGFSTMMTSSMSIGGISHRIVFSGDTIVAQEFRRSFGLGYCLGEYFYSKLAEGQENLWYVMLSKGCGTYRAMDFMFQEFAPSPVNLDNKAIAVAKRFITDKYPSREICGDIVLVAEDDAQRLRTMSSDLEIESDDLGKFFSTNNPGFASGDELICIAKVHPGNFSNMFKRVLRGVRNHEETTTSSG